MIKSASVGDPSFRALSGRLKFMVRRHEFNKDSLSRRGSTCQVAVRARLPPRGRLKKWRRPCPVANYGHPPAKVAGAPIECCRFVSMDAMAESSFSYGSRLVLMAERPCPVRDAIGVQTPNPKCRAQKAVNANGTLDIGGRLVRISLLLSY